MLLANPAMKLPVTIKHLRTIAPHLIPTGITSGVIQIDLSQLPKTTRQTPPVKARRPAIRNGQKAWPLWARLVRGRRIATDRGIGDTVERTVGLFGGPDFAFWHRLVFGDRKPCPACPAKWNREYSYAVG